MEEIIVSSLHYWHVWILPDCHIWIAGAFLAYFSVAFLWCFVFQAWRLKRGFQHSIKILGAIKLGAGIDPDDIASKAMTAPILAPLWKEYAKTLCPSQSEIDDTGQKRTIRWRATSLAEVFFTEQALVDAPLKTEFYKHLPGILTGIGIIGTFYGLIIGLSNFDVSDVTKAQTELKTLLNSVGNAFYVSAFAIILAMVFTWTEKSMVAGRYRQVGVLRQLIDSLFDAEAGGEYLERLVNASEGQATQAAQIKDALVADLKEILTTLTEQQMAAQRRQAGQMSEDVGKAIAEHLGGPMSDIASAVKNVSTNQGDAVNKLLTDVLAGFSAQMEHMFGGQVRSMTDLLKGTSEAMNVVVKKFERLAADMDSAGKGAAEAIGEKLGKALESMETRQHVMNQQMADFVGQMRALVSEHQSQSSKKLQETLGAAGEQVAGIIAELRKHSEISAHSQERRQERFEDSTGKAVSSLSGQIDKLLAQSVETNRSLQDTVSKLSQATEKTISDMNMGAETLCAAASGFAKAGQGVAETMAASSEATGNIKAVSGALVTASDATRNVLTDYGRTRDSFAEMVNELKIVTENARRDAAMSSEIISRIEAATRQLATAQKQSEDYLKGVNEVLVKVHESFAENVERSLREGNRQFQKELRDAVNLVSAAVKDLGDTLDDLPGKR